MYIYNCHSRDDKQWILASANLNCVFSCNVMIKEACYLLISKVCSVYVQSIFIIKYSKCVVSRSNIRHEGQKSHRDKALFLQHICRER